MTVPVAIVRHSGTAHYVPPWGHRWHSGFPGSNRATKAADWHSAELFHLGVGEIEIARPA
jgi:hypothetical protein